jgi:hypothetical protein
MDLIHLLQQGLPAALLAHLATLGVALALLLLFLGLVTWAAIKARA